jgi:hypothetical protein
LDFEVVLELAGAAKRAVERTKDTTATKRILSRRVMRVATTYYPRKLLLHGIYDGWPVEVTQCAPKIHLFPIVREITIGGNAKFAEILK